MKNHSTQKTQGKNEGEGDVIFNKTDNKTKKRLHLIARIVSAPIIVFTLITAVGYGWNWITTGVADPHAVEGYPFIENVPPFLMLFAVIGLVVAWFKEKIGAWINLILCAATLIVYPFTGINIAEFRSWIPMILVFIIAVPGVLFIMCWRRS